MKVMKKIGMAMMRVLQSPFLKYGLIVIVGITLVGFVGENSLWAHLRNEHYIGKLADEIEEYNERYRSDMRQIRALNRNPKAIERIARERYFMKHDDEDIFVLSDDNREYQNTAADNEGAE